MVEVVQYFHIPKPCLKDVRFIQFLVILGTPILCPPFIPLLFQIFPKHLIYYYLYINLLTFKKNASKKKHLPLINGKEKTGLLIILPWFSSSQSVYSSTP